MPYKAMFLYLHNLINHSHYFIPGPSEKLQEIKSTTIFISKLSTLSDAKKQKYLAKSTKVDVVNLRMIFQTGMCEFQADYPVGE